MGGPEVWHCLLMVGRLARRGGLVRVPVHLAWVQAAAQVGLGSGVGRICKEGWGRCRHKGWVG